MSGKREYTHVERFREEILKRREAGQTFREIAEQLKFKDKYVVKEFFKRERRKQKNIEAGIVPRQRGRQPKEYRNIEAEKDNEIKRLRMENKLLRDFLHLAGRK